MVGLQGCGQFPVHRVFFFEYRVILLFPVIVWSGLSFTLTIEPRLFSFPKTNEICQQLFLIRSNLAIPAVVHYELYLSSILL
jgi:hypothetical protein